MRLEVDECTAGNRPDNLIGFKLGKREARALRTLMHHLMANADQVMG